MNESHTSCDMPGTQSGRGTGSRILRFRPDFRWDGVPVTEYKQAADHWCGVARTVLVGDGGERTAFHVRYFEIAPDGFSSRECHAHEHVVFVLRGRGQVLLGDVLHEVGFGDTVYVAAQETHQLRNLSPSEPFGFLCVVDAERDVPMPVKEVTAART